jgi:hypothetical protein
MTDCIRAAKGVGNGMCCASRFTTYNETNNQWRSKTRLIARLLCALFIAVSLLSSAFILTHAHHAHDQDMPDGSCATCAHVMAAENLLKALGVAVMAAALYLGGRRVLVSAPKPIASDSGFFTLVSLKVRLNN